MEARYGPSERDEGTEGLDVDVTVPLQALVNLSQLYIPGKRSKVSLKLLRFQILPSMCRISSIPPRFAFDKDVSLSCDGSLIPGLGGFKRQ